MRWWKLTLVVMSACLVLALGACGDDSTVSMGDDDDDDIPVLPDAGGDDDDDGPPPANIDPCDPGPLPETCESDNDCDNQCFCDGLERCQEGTCVAAAADPCSDEVECTEDVCFEELDRCFRQPRNDECSNGEACDGFEVCNPESGCEPGTTLFCNDENSCTVDTCNDAVGCVFTRRDLDGDGFLDGRCGGEDCNDDPREGIDIFPGAPENCFNRLDDNCDGIRDFNQDTCVPGNDTCDSPRILPGPGIYSASTKLLNGDYELSCGGVGVDAVFQFTVPDNYFPDAEINAVDAEFQALGVAQGAVALRPLGECANTDPTTDLRCNDGGSPSFLARSLEPGDYVIIVSTSAQLTSFDVRLEFREPTPIPNYDECSAETETITESGTFPGRFEETEHDYQPSCGFITDGERRDGAYRLVLTEEKDVTLSLETESPDSFNEAVLAVYQGDCSDAAREAVCIADPTAEWTRRGLPAGEYFVVVEARSTNAVSWELDVEIEDPIDRLEGDACSTAVDITSGTAETVELEDFELDLRPICDPSLASGSRDAVFKFTLTDLSDVTIQTQVRDDPEERFPNDNHISMLVSPWDGCGLFATQQACSVNSSDTSFTRRSLAAGTYYVVVVSEDDSQISATAAITINPPTPIPDNDRCDSGPLPEVCDVAPVGGLKTFTSDTTWTGYNDDINGSCVSSFITSFDAVFQCTLTERSFVNVSANRTGSPTTRTVYTWIGEGGTCPGTSDRTFCTSASGSPAASSVSGTFDPGTYWIVTESRDTDAGDYRLRVFNFPEMD